MGRSGHLRESLLNGQLSVGVGDSILEVSSTPEALPRLRGLKNRGLVVGLLDEEALAFRNTPQVFSARRYSPASLKYVDAVFSAGKWHEEGLRTSTVASDSIIPSGNPRLESLHIGNYFTPEERQISQQYGDRFILVASNAGSHALSTKAFERHMSQFAAKGEGEHLVDLEDIATYRFRTLIRAKEQFQDLQNQVHFAGALGRAVDCPVVIRPHPAVDRRLFNATVRDLGFHGYIDGRFPIGPWVRSAALVVHRGCTSSIEAAVVGTPTLMLPGESMVSPPTQDVSFVADSMEEGVQLAEHLVTGDWSEEQSWKEQGLRKWIHGVDGSPSEVISDHFSGWRRDFEREVPCVEISGKERRLQTRALRRLRRAVGRTERRAMENEITLDKVRYLVSVLNHESETSVACQRIGAETFLLSRTLVNS